jgi:hypothetical protein
MKKSMLFTCIVILLFCFTGYAQTDWQLYDDFNSGQIDPNKWEIDDSCATITVENGQAKFVHQEGHANDSSYLLITQMLRTLKGVKATITIESCSGDVRARIASFIGKIGVDYVYTAHEIRADRDYISSSLPILGPAPEYKYKKDFYWGHFKRPNVYTGSSFTMSMVLSRNQAIYGVEGQGELEFSFPNTLSVTDNFFKGIGTRSPSGVGTCIVYFDDIYILLESRKATPWIPLLLDD